MAQLSAMGRNGTVDEVINISNQLFDYFILKFNSLEKVAKAVAFICSDEASYITGDIIHIDGGMHNVPPNYRGKH